jgi:hypothetical protein
MSWVLTLSTSSAILLTGNRTAHDMAAPSQGSPPQKLDTKAALAGSCPPPHPFQLERETEAMGPPKHRFDAITPSQPQKGSSLTSSRQYAARSFLVKVDSDRGQGDLVGRVPSQGSGHVPSRDLSIDHGSRSHNKVCYASAPVLFEATYSGRRQQAHNDADRRPPSLPSLLGFRLQSLTERGSRQIGHYLAGRSLTVCNSYSTRFMADWTLFRR